MQKWGSVQFSSVAQSCPTLCDPWTRPPCPSPTPGVHSNSRPSSRWCHPAISSSVVPFSSLLPSIRVFSNESVLHIRWPKYCSFSFSITPFQWLFRVDFLQGGLVGSPRSPRDSQESSPIPQVKTINSLLLIFLHSPTLTSIHDYWKNHSLD